MAADDEDVYLEAIESLERIASHGELPGDRQVVRNVFDAFAKRAKLALVEASARTPAKPG
jgi:hypothetical protein